MAQARLNPDLKLPYSVIFSGYITTFVFLSESFPERYFGCSLGIEPPWYVLVLSLIGLFEFKSSNQDFFLKTVFFNLQERILIGQLKFKRTNQG